MGPEPPRIVNAFIEITPFDLVKYEIDKVSGYLYVNRPQRTSSQPPALYGLIPRTLCGKRFASFSPTAKHGDGDPLDICVLSERPITKSGVIVIAKVIGGIRMIDNHDADDKIVAVMRNDDMWGNLEDISGLPAVLVERLEHYFKTYKITNGEDSQVQLLGTFGQKEALQVVEAASADYQEAFGKMGLAEKGK
jgi:inorganic pyrophosphatase